MEKIIMDNQKNTLQEETRYVAFQDYQCLEHDGQILLISRLDSTWVRTNAMGVRLLQILKSPKYIKEVLWAHYGSTGYLISRISIA